MYISAGRVRPRVPVRRLFVACVAIVALFIGFMLLRLADRRPPFEFIQTLNGKEIADPWSYLQPRPTDEVVMVYIFPGPIAPIREAIQNAPDHNSFPLGTDGRDYSISWRERWEWTNEFGNGSTPPAGMASFIILTREPDWLEQKWEKIKGWFRIRDVPNS
jgi:hypothetical protein